MKCSIKWFEQGEGWKVYDTGLTFASALAKCEELKQKKEWQSIQLKICEEIHVKSS